MKPIELESELSNLAVDEGVFVPDRQPFTRKLPAIQILRGIAAALVVLHHFSQAVERQNPQVSWLIASGFANIGAAGVDIFFVISGFIMFYTTTRNDGWNDARTFLRKRALRIYPLYWIWSTVLLLIVLSNLIPGSHGVPSFDGSKIRFLVGSYLLFPVFNGVRFHPFLDQGWTLSFEMLFYCIFALGLSLKLRGSILSFLTASFVGLFLLGLWLPQTSGMRYLFSNTLVLEFLLGAFLAKAFLENRLDFLRSAALWAPVGLIAVGCAALMSVAFLYAPDRWYTPESWRFVFWGAPSALIVVGFVTAGQRFANPVLEYLGDASFSTYLAHTFFVGAFRAALAHLRILSAVPPDVVILLGSILTITLTLITYQFVEKPLVPLLNAPWRGRK